jgi:hypothetical protein
MSGNRSLEEELECCFCVGLEERLRLVAFLKLENVVDLVAFLPAEVLGGRNRRQGACPGY